MIFEDIARRVVDTLNAKNIPQNDYDRYVLNHRYGGCSLSERFHQAVIYHSGGRCTEKPWGPIAWTNANDKCRDFDTACKHMLMRYLSFEFDTPEELELKLTIRGMI